MTLADHLRGLPDEELAALLRARPDLAVPAPGDFSAMAHRAQSRLSVARALEDLDLFTLEILDALRLLGGDPAHLGSHPVPTTELLGLVAGAVDDDAVHDAVARLREKALVYGDPALHLVPTVADCCSPYPANLGRPAAELDPVAGELAADPAALRRALLAAPEPARRVLDRLAAGPPVGTVSAARRTSPDSPVGWLLSRHLLLAVAEDTVELPRELGLLLRHLNDDAGPLGQLHPAPPPVDPPRREPGKLDAAGAGQAMEAVRQTEALLEALTAEPPPLLRAGGIGIRELRRLARAAGVDEPLAALLLEVAGTAGLIDDDREAEPHWLPTPGYDRWRDADLAARWTRLAAGWLSMTREPGLVGSRDERDRLRNVLSGDVERIVAPALRKAALRCLAGLGDAAAPSAEQITGQLAWQTPRRGGRHRDDAVRWTLSQAAALGITGLGALTSYGRSLLAGDDTEATAVLGKLLPEPVDHVLLQADLTAVVPGPPVPSLAAELSLVADPESAGGASVYRVTRSSVRRALDAGMVADDLHGLFARRSVTPVPQGLTYLIDDVARQHGGMRVGSAGAYLRGDDEARLAELLADRRLAALGLRRLAPTVLVTPYSPGRLIASLRESGYVPVPEDTTGTVVVSRPDARRAPSRPRVPRPAEQLGSLDPDRARAVVEAVRRGDETARRARRAPVATRADPPGSVSETLAVLQQALRAGREVRVGYVDSHGGDASRLVRPVSMGGGYLRAEDRRTETVHTFALHRLTSATLAE